MGRLEGWLCLLRLFAVGFCFWTGGGDLLLCSSALTSPCLVVLVAFRLLRDAVRDGLS